jgi:hypothetical protein
MKAIHDYSEADKPIYHGLTERTLNRAFNAVADPDDWKAPIKTAHVTARDLTETCAAIVYYTSTWPKIDYCPATGGFWVSADGYRTGPAGDH